MGKDKRKPLVEMDSENGKIIRFWESGKDAAAFYEIRPELISMCVKGNAKHAKKKYFRYATEEESALYRDVKQKVEEPAPAPVPPVIDVPDIPVEIIPETVERPPEELTPFDRLIKKGKEKLI